jgi:hypothetical protein
MLDFTRAFLLLALLCARAQLQEDCSRHTEVAVNDESEDDVSLIQSIVTHEKSNLAIPKNQNKTDARAVRSSRNHSRAFPTNVALMEELHAADWLTRPVAFMEKQYRQYGKPDSWAWPLTWGMKPNDPHLPDIKVVDGDIHFFFRHPSGVISNVNGGVVVWANVWYLNLSRVFWLCLVAYPFIGIAIVLFLAIVVGMCLATEPGGFDPAGPPAVAISHLTPTSKRLYQIWVFFCSAIPALLVFATPMMLVWLSISKYGPEVYASTLIISSVFVFSNGLYCALYAPITLNKMSQNMDLTIGKALEGVTADKQQELVHWVIFPNYMEDEDILAQAVGSVAKSSLASSSICILLAMEYREGELAKRKSENLCDKFAGKFKEMYTTYHPKDDPNPPGKASNVAYAFKELTAHLKEIEQDEANVMLTIADADTEFHELYFEFLLRQHIFAENPNTTIWQSAVMHMKNYHRQPGPVSVGTVFTTMTELSFMGDTNAVRFPYSSYSLPCQLATSIGGWDPEWIAEDWHLGIKCFLFTLGRAEVKTIMLPALNYSPEAPGELGSCTYWFATNWARWAQAKRHALGFSDVSYYFMMLPLIFLHVSTAGGKYGMLDFWSLFFKGLTRVIRLVNTHVVLGVMALYGIMDLAIRFFGEVLAHQGDGVQRFFDRTFFHGAIFTMVAAFFSMTMIFNFLLVYSQVKNRMEKAHELSTWFFQGPCTHALLLLVNFLIAGPIFFFALAVGVWIAAFKMLFTQKFDYEVAAKPTKEQCTSG